MKRFNYVGWARAQSLLENTVGGWKNLRTRTTTHSTTRTTTHTTTRTKQIWKRKQKHIVHRSPHFASSSMSTSIIDLESAFFRSPKRPWSFATCRKRGGKPHGNGILRHTLWPFLSCWWTLPAIDGLETFSTHTKETLEVSEAGRSTCCDRASAKIAAEAQECHFRLQKWTQCNNWTLKFWHVSGLAFRLRLNSTSRIDPPCQNWSTSTSTVLTWSEFHRLFIALLLVLLILFLLLVLLLALTTRSSTRTTTHTIGHLLLLVLHVIVLLLVILVLLLLAVM